MRDYPGQSGTKRDKTPVFAVVFGRRRGQMGIKTIVPRFSPIRRFSRRLGTVLTPGKACLKGLAALTPTTTQATILGPDSTVIELVALLRAQPFRKQRGRRGIRERSDATLLKEFGRLVAALRPRAGLMENVPAVPVAFAEALGAAPMKAAA